LGIIFLALVAFNLAVDYPIKNVVVLMLENRSFDHMCGFLKRVNPEVEGLFGNETNPNVVGNPTKGYVKVGETAPYVARWDPDHSLEGTSFKIFGKTGQGANPAPMDGFVEHEAKQLPPSDVINMFEPTRVPVISALATEFALFDRWFASVPGPTHPNRLYALTATSHGTINNDVPTEGLPQEMFFDKLDEVNATWGLYYTDAIWALMLGRLRTKESKTHIKTWAQFLTDVKDGKLPNYTWLEPRFALDPTTKQPAQDQHPDHPVQAGEGVMKEVYEALRSGPLWNSTLFLITYDEHGGYYDHYPTPQDGVPNPDDLAPTPPLPSHFNFNRTGVRVPTIAISPWIEKGTVVHGPKGPSPSSQYDHSSIPATLKKLFNTKTFLTKRDEWAGTFENLFLTRTTPRTDCPTKLPDPPTISEEDLAMQATLPVNDLQCDYIKAFPGSHKNCHMTQLEAAHYFRYLAQTMLKE